MEEELDPEIIKATQSSLGKYIKRPPLTDKLLKKPPFRFLHDIITTIIKTTGFFNGLFEEEELKSDNVKERESKILFLNKVISVIGTTTGNSLSVKPSKIVSGQEPEKTNELLQCLALALDKKLSSDDAVKQYKESVKPHDPGIKTKDSTKVVKKNQQVKKLTSSHSTEKLIKNDKNDSITNKTKQKENTTKKESAPKRLPTQSTIQSKVTSKKGPDKKKQDSGRNSKLTVIRNNNPNDFTATKQQSLNIDETLSELELTQENQSLVLPAEVNDSNVSKIEIDDSNNGNDSNDSINHNKLSAPVDLKDTILHKKKEDINEIITNSVLAPEESNHVTDNKIESNENETKNDTNQTEKQLKETSNKIEIEKIPKNEDKINDPEPVKPVANVKRPSSVRPSSSRPSAPRLRDKHENVVSNENIILGKVNIISENTPEEEDDNSIVIVDNTQDTANEQNQGEQLRSPSHQHGHLVQQILEAQKEFSQVSGKTEIEWQLGVQKSRDAVHEDIEQLRFNVQALSRVANPLGKLLDHIQEDVEVMRQELQQWTNTYEEASKELLKQRASNEESLYPLHTKIKQLDVNIGEKRDKINDLKIVIHKNAFRIEKLLSSGQMQYL